MVPAPFHSRRRFTRLVVVVTLLLGVAAATVAARSAPPRSHALFAHFDTLTTRVAPDSVGRWVLGPECGASADTTARAVAAVLRARQLLAGARYASCAGQANAALAHARATGDRLLECRALYALAMAHALSGDVAPAGPLARRLLALARATGLPRDAACARLTLAYLDILAERWPAAERGYRAALAGLSPAFDATLRRVARVGLARAVFNQGRVREARALDVVIVREARASGDAVNEAFALNNLAVHDLMAGDPADAIPNWRRALALQRDAGRAPEAATTATNLASALIRLRRFDEAAGVLEEYADSTRTPMRLGQRAEVVSLLASVRSDQNRNDEALRLVSRAWRMFAAAGERPSRQLLHTRLSLAADAGEAASAVEIVDAWLLERPGDAPSPDDALLVQGMAANQLLRAHRWGEALERWHALVADLDSAGTLGQVKYSYARLGEALAHFGLGERAEGREAAFAALRAWERGRAGYRAPEWRELLERDGTRYWGDVLAQLRLGPGGTREAFDTAQRLKARTFGERMRGGRVAPTTSVALQRRVLRAGEVVFDAYPGGDSVLVFVLTRGRLLAYTVPDRVGLQGRVARFRSLALAPEAAPGVVDGAGRALAHELLGPAAAWFAGAAQVIVTSDGLSDELPWDPLVAPNAKQPLGARSAVASVPSLSALARLRERPAPARSAGPIVLAGLTGTDGRVLAGAREESEFLRSRFAGADVRAPRSGAEVRSALAALSRAGSIHVAAHFSADPENPWRNGILMGPPDRDDAWLRPADVEALPLDASLAVLAGCASTAAGEQSLSGQRGLATAFLAAGTRAVVGTLGPVEDRASVALVRALYAELESGAPAGVALARARAAVRTSWGAVPSAGRAFVLLGDPGTRVSLARRGAAGIPGLGR